MVVFIIPNIAEKINQKKQFSVSRCHAESFRRKIVDAQEVLGVNQISTTDTADNLYIAFDYTN
jgi:hypothetical protein